MIAFILFVKLLIIKDSCQNIQDCLGPVCFNNGTLEKSSCTCECSAKFSGINCEYEIESSNWPPGPYAIPTPIDGCPETYRAGWTEGYINITTRVPLGIWITQNDLSKTTTEASKINGKAMVNIAEDRLHIPYSLGPYGRYTFQFNFCYKIQDHTSNLMESWPPGNYFIYGAEKGCPKGFASDYITVTLPEVMAVSRDGDLPYMDIRVENDEVKISLGTCKRLDDPSPNIKRFWADTPFILIQAAYGSCATFDGFHVSSEYLHAAQKDKTDTKRNLERFFLHMCYYTPFDYSQRIIDNRDPENPLSSCQMFESVIIHYFQTWGLDANSDRSANLTSPISEDYILDLLGHLSALENHMIVAPVIETKDDVPWMLFDLKQARSIHSICMLVDTFKLETNYWVNFWNYPELFVSNDRWSFLNNGAILGRTITYRHFPRLIQIFLKQMEGRYLSVVATKYKIDILTTEFFLNIKQFNIFQSCGNDIKEAPIVCYRELGMLDNIIQDYQLSASSWQHDHTPGMARQYRNGWCADIRDVNQFLQIDLILSTAINGITVINDYGDNVYEEHTDFSRKVFLLGSKSFRLMYGTRLESLTNYNAVFQLDLSLPFTNPHTKIFRKPFLARYVRIYPQVLPNNDTPCLRLELLGCAKSVIPSQQCDDNSIVYKTYKTSAPIPVNKTTVIYTDVSWSYCSELCLHAARNCESFQYKRPNCIIYSPSKTSRFVRYIYVESDNLQRSRWIYAYLYPVDPETVITPFDETFTSMACLTGSDYKPSVQLFVDRGIFREIHNDNMFSIIGPGVITSLGYPYHYLTDQLYMWNITFEDSVYISLIFSNISLHVYKPFASILTLTDQLYMWNITFEDSGYIRLIFSNISLHVYKGVTYNNIADCNCRLKTDVIEIYSGESKDDLFHAIDYRNNGDIPTIATSHTTVYLVFRTCYRNIEKAEIGIGFRAFVTKKVLPNCFNAGQRAVCDKWKMTFGSPSYFGLNRGILYTWQIKVNDVRTINMKIIDFDVNCQYDASFILREEESTKHDQSYCNSKRPVGLIKSKYNYLLIQYRTPLSEYHFFDGFYAEYSLSQTNPVVVEIASTMSVHSMTYIPPNYHENVKAEYSKVCSDVLGKCYFIIPSYGRSWEEASDYCWLHEMYLVSFHSQLELQLLRQALVEFSKNSISELRDIGFSYFRLSSRDPLLYSYIGLRRYTDSTFGQHDELWDDSTLLTFTSWADKQPADVHRQQCTRMGFHLHNEVHTWETTECDVKPGTAGFFICQKSNPTSKEVKGLRNKVSELSPSSDTTGYLFYCEDGTWISPLSVCNGIADCLDWSDEVNCIDVLVDDDMFPCDDGRHVHISYLCNYVPDCYDGSDENCEFPGCESSDFQCDNMQCVPNVNKCDAVFDCLDGSDEMNCDTCNSTVAFKCVERSCIPLSQVCDNHVDCGDGWDEQSCERQPMTSCGAFWEAGYRDNGIYNLIDGNVECQFYIQLGDVDIIVHVETLIHDVYLDYILTEGNVQLPQLQLSNALLNRLTDANVCEQQIISICEPYLLAVAEYDGIHNNVLYSLYAACACQMWKIEHPFKKMYAYQPCSNSFPKQLNYTNPLVSNDTIRHILKPVVCNTELTVVTKTLSCENSRNVIPYSIRCLYSADQHGRIDGCRSLSHLQNCETVECPAEYAKCPASYCIARKHICDGTKHCPDGQDENNCWRCLDNRRETVILFYAEDVNANIRKVIYNLATQLYISSGNARVLKLTTNATTVYLNAPHELSVSDETIDSNDERMNRYKTDTYTIRSKDFVNHIRNSFTNTTQANNIIFILGSKSLIEQVPNDEMDDVNTLYFTVDFNKSISKEIEFIKESRITKMKIRRTEVNAVINTFFLKELCEERDNSSCKNMYKCASSRVCIFLSQVCDAKRDCPSGDDEHDCRFRCPNKCRCKGLSVHCSNVQFQISDFVTISSESRALDLSLNNNVSIVNFNVKMTYLYKLNISNSGLQFINRSAFFALQNLKILDISSNKLKSIVTDTFKHLKSLTTLYLSDNNLLSTIERGAFNGLTKIRELTITGTRLNTILFGTFAGLQLSKLDLRSNEITTIEAEAFSDLEVETIYISRNDITKFNKDMFTGVQKLQVIHSSDYKFCCLRPSTVQEEDCHPYKDEFSSCADLMRNNGLQALLWVIGISALVGNVMSLAYRFIRDKQRLKLGYGIFVTNLSVADLLMGVYLLIIAVADTIYRDRYIWNDDKWRNSIWCTIAGVLSTVSFEASVLFMSLITIDRLLVIKFPFGQLRFKTTSAILACFVSWVIAILIAVFPLMHTDYFQDQFYTKSGVCLALPLTRDRQPGWQYSLAIFIGFNFMTFLLIAVGQWLIYNEIHRSKLRANSQSKSRGNDLKIARNLLLVVSTDFVCWFPIGCMGLMALNGHAISGDVYAWTAVLILPINSAINPFLYTLSAMLNKRNFEPSVDEQSRTQQVTHFSDYGKGIVKIWESRVLRPPQTNMAVNMTSLRQFVETNDITPGEILTIAVQLTCGVRYLHACSLVLKKFDMNDVRAVTRIDTQVLDYVQLQLMPCECNNSEQKTEDVYHLGVIIRKLLKYNKRSDGVLRTVSNVI